MILTSSAGLGHLSASKAIKRALEDLYPGRVAVRIANPLENNRVPALLRGSTFDYDQVVRERLYLHKFTYWFTNQAIPSSVYQLIMARACSPVIGDMVDQFQPDVVLLTYLGYHSSLKAIFTKKKRVPVLTVVTDLADVHRLWFHPVSDFLLVPTLQVAEQARAHHVAGEKIKVTGIPVHPGLGVPYPAQDILRAGLGWQTNKLTVLAVSSKRVRNIDSYLLQFNQSDLPIQLVVIAGGDEDLYRQLQLIDWKITTHFYAFVEDISRYLRASDLVMSKAGGLIVSESLACGRPLLLVEALPGQEIGNVRFVIEEGVGEYAHAPAEALVILRRWSAPGSPEYLKKLQRAAEVGRPQAAYEVARLVWSVCSKE